MAMPADEPRLPVLLEAITNGPILAVKEEIGPESCAHVSTYLAEVLTRFGYRAVAMPVSAAIFPKVLLGGDDEAVSRWHRTGGISLFTLGQYDNQRLTPIPGMEMDGYVVAGHVITVVKGSPNLLVDGSLDQANKWAGSGCPPCRPMYLKRLSQFPLPGHQERYPLDDDQDWMLQYDWLAEDPSVLKKLRREPSWYNGQAELIRSLIAAA
jgi:hypothetical protein